MTETYVASNRGVLYIFLKQCLRLKAVKPLYLLDITESYFVRIGFRMCNLQFIYNGLKIYVRSGSPHKESDKFGNKY